MQPKRSKYDTNPLDANVADRANESFGPVNEDHTAKPTGTMDGAPTREIGRTETDARLNPGAEAPTRRIDDEVTSYPSIFVPPKPREQTYYEPPKINPNIYQPPVPPPTVYQPPPVPIAYPSTSRKVVGLGIPEKWAVMLPYLPFWPAIVIAIVELLLAPRTETRTRFHASQALLLQIGITAISMLVTFGSLFTERWTGAGLFNFASFVFLIIAMIRVWKGKPLAIPPLDEPRKWLDEKIKPRK